MKRFWLILLSLGLVMAFSASAFAVDVQFSGSFYVGGLYLDQVNLVKSGTTGMQNQSTAFFYQRLRVETDFIVSPGLKLVTRFDALERIWGGARAGAATGLGSGGAAGSSGYPSTSWPSAGTAAEDENIAFDWAYIDYTSPYGQLMVGYMQDGKTGTIFGDSYVPRGRIKYYLTVGPVTFNPEITVVENQDYSAVNPTATWTDANMNHYGLDTFYQGQNLLAGGKVTYYRYAQNRPNAAGSDYTEYYYLLTPYVITKIGPVNLQAEVNYAWGKYKMFDGDTLGKDINLSDLTAFLDATATFGPIYFGGTFAYVQGTDPNYANDGKPYSGALNGGIEWNPCLIMFNYYDRGYWVGPISGYTPTSNVGPMTNAWFFQANAGVTPTPALNIKASVAYAKADQPGSTTPGWAGDLSYGWELDVTGTYKITNNLSYMLSVGYWWVGDYYRGPNTQSAAPLRDDYMVINKLTLTF